MKHRDQKKKVKQVKQAVSSAFTLYCVAWVAYEDDEFGYPETDGYSLHVSEYSRDTFIKERMALSPVLSPSLHENIVDPALYRKVRDKGGDLLTARDLVNLSML